LPVIPPKTTKRALSDHAPWKPVEWEEHDVGAIQALARGDADADTQKRALVFVIEKVCGTYQPSYRAGGEEGRRDTDFAEGRRYVGLQLVKFVKLNLSALRRNRNG